MFVGRFVCVFICMSSRGFFATAEIPNVPPCPDCDFSEEAVCLGRFRPGSGGVMFLLILILALSAVDLHSVATTGAGDGSQKTVYFGVDSASSLPEAHQKRWAAPGAEALLQRKRSVKHLVVLSVA